MQTKLGMYTIFIIPNERLKHIQFKVVKPMLNFDFFKKRACIKRGYGNILADFVNEVTGKKTVTKFQFAFI